MRVRATLAHVLLGTTATIALAGLAGKATHNPYLQCWNPRCVSMKDTTAWIILEHTSVGFLISRPDRRLFPVPAVIAAVITFLMAVGLVGEIGRLENLASFNPLASWYPSIVTVCAGALLGIKALASATFRAPIYARVSSMAVAAIGATALTGYAFNLPRFYYFIPGLTTAMAVNTASCFLLLGCVPTPEANP